jgi:hypothetical protein
MTESLEEFKERMRKTYTPIYFDREGQEISFDEFCIKCNDLEYKIISQDQIGKYFVSTVWIGLDMGIFRHAAPEIFETMIFVDESEEDFDNELNYYQDRHSTEIQAKNGHARAIDLVMKKIDKDISTALKSCLEAESSKGSQSECPDLQA